MCRKYEPYQSLKQDACDEDDGCGRNMHERQKRCGRRKRMRIKNNADVTSRGSRRNRVTISEKKSRIRPIDFILTET